MTVVNDHKAFSPLARHYSDIGGRAQTQVDHIDVHITGTGTHARALKAKQDSGLRVANYFGTLWARALAKQRKDSVFAHFIIDPWGKTLQVASCLKRPGSQSWGAHGGRRGLEQSLRATWLYRNGQGSKPATGDFLAVPEWWTAYWGPKLQTLGVEPALRGLLPTSMTSGHSPLFLYSPLDLVGQDGSPNDHSISIECIQAQSSYSAWSKGKRNYLLTTAQYISLNTLVQDRLAAWGLEWTPMTVRGHESSCPWTRGDAAGGWDPGAHRVVTSRFCWRCAKTLDFRHSGSVDLCPAILDVRDLEKRAWELGETCATALGYPAGQGVKSAHQGQGNRGTPIENLHELIGRDIAQSAEHDGPNNNG